MARRIRRTNRKNSKRLNSRRRTNRKNSKRLNSRRRTNRKNSKRLNSRRRSKVLNRKRTMKRNVKYQKGGNLMKVDDSPTNFTYNDGNYECLLVGNTLPLFIGDKITVEFERLPIELEGTSARGSRPSDFYYGGIIDVEYKLPFENLGLGIDKKISLKDVNLKITEHIKKTGSNRPKNTAGIYLNDGEILDIIRAEAEKKEAAGLAAIEVVNNPDALIEMIKAPRGKTPHEIYSKGEQINRLLTNSTYSGIKLNIDLDGFHEGKLLRNIINANFSGEANMDNIIISKIEENALISVDVDEGGDGF